MQEERWQLRSLSNYFSNIWNDNRDRDASRAVIDLFETNCSMAEEMTLQVQYSMRERYRKCQGLYSPSQIVMNGEDYSTIAWLGMHMSRMRERARLMSDELAMRQDSYTKYIL